MENIVNKNLRKYNYFRNSMQNIVQYVNLNVCNLKFEFE